MKDILLKIKDLGVMLSDLHWLHYVLFGFMPSLASHLARSLLSRSYGYDYGYASDRTTCLASLTLNSKSFMKYPG